MVTFHHQSFDTTSLVNDLVNAIKEDSNKRLWIGTYDGLSIFNPEKFCFSDINQYLQNQENKEFGNVLSIDMDNNGGMWVSTVANGLFYFDGKSGKMIRYKNDKNSGGISSNLVNVVKCDSKGRVWVGTRDGLS
jgi:sugar lactone lactonase YvrE